MLVYYAFVMSEAVCSYFGLPESSVRYSSKNSRSSFVPELETKGHQNHRCCMGSVEPIVGPLSQEQVRVDPHIPSGVFLSQIAVFEIPDAVDYTIFGFQNNNLNLVPCAGSLVRMYCFLCPEQNFISGKATENRRGGFGSSNRDLFRFSIGCNGRFRIGE